MSIIAQGAEAVLSQESNRVIKERVTKSYRLPEIDRSLRRSRTRREAKVLAKLADIGVPCPQLLKSDDKRMELTMEFIDGSALSDLKNELLLPLAEQIGAHIGRMHAHDIIHGDLTTANMILKGKTVFLIDFGLSFFSTRDEDRAVDLHVLAHALEAKHGSSYRKVWPLVLEGYKKGNSHHEAVLTRLEKVESRGRNKAK